MESNALVKAIELLGGVSNAARVLPGVKNYQTVQQWRVAGVPAERCPDSEEATGGKVTCEELRPDVNWAVLRNFGASETAKKIREAA